MTEREILAALAKEDVIRANPVYKEYIDKKIAQNAPKPDELTDKIVEILENADGFVSIKNILAAINDKEISASKIVPRLTKLCKDGTVEKVQATLADKSKVMTYSIVKK